MPFAFHRFFALFLRVGNLTFGGGDPTMAVFYQELVEIRRWITQERYGLIYGLARITPGTNLLAFCAGVGWDLARFAGALAAVIAVSGPAAFLVVWFTVAYESWRTHPLAMAVIGGTIAAAVGMMWGGAILLVRPHATAHRWMRAAAIAVGAFLAARAGMSPIQILALAAIAGAFWRNA
jgi:chromate transporter